MFVHVFLFLCLSQLLTISTAAFVVPEAKVQALSPKGLRVSIPDSPGMTLFAFHGNVNEQFEGLEAGQMARDVIKKRGDRWVFEDKNIRLKQGDIVYYWLYVIIDGLGYQGLDRSYTVTGFDSFNTSDPIKVDSPSCFNSPTRMNGQTQCSGQLIFDRKFVGNQLDKNTWSHDIQIGGYNQDDEFVVFNNDPANTFLLNNNLVIKPSLLEKVYDENFIKSGQLMLNGCTSKNIQFCEKKAQTYLIMLPVLSARLTTKNSFSFLYGIVEIKAKFPQGDWIVPELWLEQKETADSPNSERIILGLSRGNKQLTGDGTDLSNKQLTAGVIYDNVSRLFKKTLSTGWSQDYHLYKVTWNPNGLIFTVDNEEIGRLTGSNSPSFDKEFYITLGVHVGGIRDFPDSSVSGNHEKPWRNTKPNKVLTFWRDKNTWYPTWNDNSALRIEYVKVWAF